MFGVILIIAIIVVFVWVVAGGIGTSTGQGGSPIQGCDGCDGLRAWWDSLTPGQKSLKAAWYATRWAYCRGHCRQ